MSRNSRMLPTIIGHKYRKGIFCVRSSMGGYDMYIVTLKKEYRTGEKYDLSDIEQVHDILHFCDRSAVEETIKALEWILKKGVEHITYTGSGHHYCPNCGAIMESEDNENE